MYTCSLTMDHTLILFHLTSEKNDVLPFQEEKLRVQQFCAQLGSKKGHNFESWGPIEKPLKEFMAI